MSSMAGRLSDARRRRFVGRADEVALLRAALSADELPYCVLHVHGPGGVGKTTLLAEFRQIATDLGFVSVGLDGRTMEPTPEGFLYALSVALGAPADVSPYHAFASRGGRQVLTIDTFEVLAPLDLWLRDIFIPQLPGDTMIVFAGRHPPSAGWRADPAWQDLVRILPLRNLRPEESRRLLAQRNVPEDQHQAALEFTHGHPLALALVGDVFAQRGAVEFGTGIAPDVVKNLLDRFVQEAPSVEYRRALEACALVRVLTEDLLSALIDSQDAFEAFEWLRSLSFVEAGTQGLIPHDVAREALTAELRWRNPDRYADLHRRARAYYLGRFQKANPLQQQRILFDYIFLHRDNPVVQPFFEWSETGGHTTDVARADDIPALLAMVEQHEGPESAALVERWLRRSPAVATVFRDSTRRPEAFHLTLNLGDLSDAERLADPAVAAAWKYVTTRAPLRQGELAFFYRAWMAEETYQDVSPLQGLIFVSIVRQYLTTPGLAVSLFPVADADFWLPVLSYADLTRAPEADYSIGGRRYGMFMHDWRTTPPLDWLALLAEREIATEVNLPEPVRPEPVLVLSQPEFAAAVRDGLRDLLRPEALLSNPLLRSRLVLERAAGKELVERVGALQTLLRDAAAVLQRTPREERLYRAVDRTYLRPAPTQEKAAELLDVPFSTYRRHLTTGLQRITDILWTWELHGGGSEHGVAAGASG